MTKIQAIERERALKVVLNYVRDLSKTEEFGIVWGKDLALRLSPLQAMLHATQVAMARAAKEGALDRSRDEGAQHESD
jgi:hypothetical protein